MIVALVLAAGASKRFGAQKLLQDLAGTPVLRWSVNALAGVRGVADEVVVVVPPEHATLRDALRGASVRLVVNERAADGMGASLACGVRALGPDVDAVLVALGDEPRLTRGHHERVVDRYRPGGVAIVAPTYRGARGHPVLFDRRVFPELATLTGDRGARSVVERDPRRVELLEMNEPHPVDVDTPEDLARVRSDAQLSANPRPATGDR